jgi:hypothetical protein
VLTVDDHPLMMASIAGQIIAPVLFHTASRRGCNQNCFVCFEQTRSATPFCRRRHPILDQ